MKCFIACAFDKTDVDKTYKVICKVLKSHNIIPLRVDRITHNEKIDSKILSLIQECDFGIADLTYARPSVYYEAGRIHGMNKQVIFTCRPDHFKPAPDDLHGNLRIHFDLITENVLAWSKPARFETLLNARVKRVIKPLLLKLEASRKQSESVEKFNKLSVVDRKRLVENTTLDYLTKLKFRPSQAGYSSFIYFRPSQKDIVYGYIQPKFSASGLYRCHQYIHHVLNSVYNKRNMKATRVTVLVLSLSLIRRQTIESCLSWYNRADDDYKIYKTSVRMSDDNIESRFVVIDKIASELQYRDTLDYLFKQSTSKKK